MASDNTAVQSTLLSLDESVCQAPSDGKGERTQILRARLVEETDPYVRLAYVYSVRALGSDECLYLLARTAAVDPVRFVRLAALNAVGGLLVGGFDPDERNPDRRTRYAAAQAIVRPILTGILRDRTEAPFLRRGAERLLQYISA